MTPDQFLSVAELLPEAMWLLSSTGEIAAANAAAGRLVGRAPQACRGMRLGSLVVDTPAHVADYLRVCSRTRALTLGALTFRHAQGAAVACRAEGALAQPRTASTPALLLLRCKPKPVAAQAFVALNEKIQELIRTNTRLRRTQALLQGERERFEVTLTSIGDAVMVTDTGGRITFMNPVAEALTGWSSREAVGKAVGGVFHIVNMETREPADDPVAQVLREGTVVGLANHTALLARDGTERPIDDSGAPIRTPDGRLTGVVLVFRDVSARRQAEQALRQSEARFRTLTTVAPVGIFLTDITGDCLFVNDRWCEMAGLSPDEAKGRGWMRALHPEDRERVFQGWYAAAQTGDEFSAEYRFQTAEGRMTWLAGTAVPLTDEHGTITGYLGTVTDITARQRAEAALEASEAQLRLVTDSAPVFLAHCDAEGRYRFVNRGYAERFGLSRDDVVGRRIPEVLGEAAYTSFRVYVERALAGEPVEFEVEVPYQTIGPRWMHCAYAPEVDATGVVQGLIAVITDVTARKRMEAQLEASLHEKEVLLKEVHHRVKNNLQIIASLLSLQQDLTADPQVLALFEDSARRIGSIALVHETLYQRSDLAAFDLAAYIRTLSAQLLHAYGVEAQQIALHLELDAVTLPLDMAVPCGLILNELLSNCFKHAFPDGHTGEVTVRLAREADRVHLIVRDNGCGLPEHLDVRTTESLGLQLVCALTEQLQGMMALERHGGTAFILTVPLPSRRWDEVTSARAPSDGALRG